MVHQSANIKFLKSGGVLGFISKLMEPAVREAVEVMVIIDNINKCKSIPNSLLDTGYSLVDNKINVDLLYSNKTLIYAFNSKRSYLSG